MNCLCHARSYISLGLLKRSSYVASHISTTTSVYCFSSRSKPDKPKPKPKITKAAAAKDKDAFFLVRKGDTIGVFKDLGECQAQVGSSVFDPPVSIFKGYSLSKDAQDYLSSVGLKNPLYSFRASDLQEDMFGALTSCLLQDLSSCKDRVSKEEDTSEIKSKDKKDQLPSASMSADPLEKSAKPEPSACNPHETCYIAFDGASKGNPGLAGAAAVLKNVDGSLICRVRQGLGIATSNAAEYHALILGLKHAIEKGYKRIKVQGDSKLVCMQIRGQWKVNNEGLAKLHMEAKELTARCSYFEIRHVLRHLNSDADEQANLASRLCVGKVEVA